MSPSVCAVVVTFNRGELLLECLDALAAQSHPVERVIVIDNASTDGTPDLLREHGALEREGLDYVRLEENRGSSGGFAAGVEAGLAAGLDWLWLMDDDAEPEPDTLALLLGSGAAADPGTAALCPAVVLPDGTVDVKHRGLFKGGPDYLPLEQYVAGTAPRLEFFTWVGLLVRTEAARGAGLPHADFFIWADDYEYSFRVRKHGAIRLVPESRIVHKDVGQAYSNRRGRFWNRLTGWDYDSTPADQFWRNLCGVRNYIWMKQRHERQGALSAAATTAQFMVKSLLYDERPLRRLPWIARFALDGRRGEFSTIRPREWRAMVRDGRILRRPAPAARPRPSRSAEPGD
jgi:rhamnopyranosyl-N-acetylglucosaminyl-diphospho-decaprenol beta-1,3/1,4-galactofuranosyltransferase